MTVIDSVPKDARSIKGDVDPDCGQVTRDLMADQAQTILYESLNGGKAVGNRFSTRAKIASALGIPADGIVNHLLQAVDRPQPCEVTGSPAFKARCIPVDLMKLPIPTYFPEDGGRYITSGIVVAEYGGKRNVSFHRMMIMDSGSIAIRLVPRHLFTLYNNAKKDGKELNISICIGACAEALLAAATSMDFGADELEVASAMCVKGHGKPLQVGRCDNGLLVPADTDYVLEGRITLEEAKEGPFVDITGTYDFERMQPVIKIDKVWTCEDPVFHLLLPGGWEHFLLMGLPREPMILKTVRQAVPRVANVRLTEGGCCWLNGVVSIKKNKEGDGVNAIMAAFTGHPSMKQVIIVDDDIDIFDDRQVEWAVATRMQADRILKVPGAAGSSLDPSSHGKTTWKVGFDATIPLDADRSLYVKAVPKPRIDARLTRDRRRLRRIGRSNTLPSRIPSAAIRTPQDGKTDKKLLIALALALLTLPALVALGDAQESEALQQGSTYRSGVTDYYVLTDPGTKSYTDSTLPSAYIYIDCSTIKARAFANCTKLADVIFSPQVKTVGEEAFKGCTGLYSVEAKDVETIGAYAFANSTLHYIGFGGKLTSLGDHAFDGCSRLGSFSTWSTMLTSFGDYVFSGTALTAIDLRGITSVSPTAFSGLTIRAQVVATGQTLFLPGIATVYIEDRKYINSISANTTDISVGVRTTGYRAMVQDLQGNDVSISETINYPWYSFTIPYEAEGVYVVSALSYTITFPSSMGLDPVVLVSGNGSVQLPHPDIEGMSGWTIDGSSTFWSISETAISPNRTVALKAMVPGLVETYDHSALSGRTDTSMLPVQMAFVPGDKLATLPDVVGYRFVGWEVDGAEYSAGDQIPSYQNHVAKSLWAATIVRTVSYPALGLEEPVEYGAPYYVTSSAAAEADSQRFIGWSADGGNTVLRANDPLNVTRNVVLAPVFEERTPFTVALVDRGGTVSETTVYDGRSYTISAEDPQKEFGAFRHWNLDGEVYIRGDSFHVTADTVLQAVWSDMPTSTVTYHIGSGDVSYTYLSGYPMTIYCDVQPDEGMVLSGWSLEEGSGIVAHANGSMCSLESDLDLYPVWAVGERVIVTFHGTTGGDVAIPMIPGKVMDVTQAAPAIEHFRFLGWSLSDGAAAADFPIGSEIAASRDIDLYPLYVEDPKATLTYILHDGSDSIVVYAGTTVTVGAGGQPSRDGYTFSGWRDAASSEIHANGESMTVLHDMILVAEWELIPDTITLTFHGTTEGDVTIVMIAGDVAQITQAAPAIEHFRFLGWSHSASASSADYTVGSEISAFGDIDLYPLYVEDPKATLTYINQTVGTSAVLYYGTTVTVGTGSQPVRDGYEFAGWKDAKSSAVYANGDSLTVTHDMILVADWTLIPITVRLTFHGTTEGDVSVVKVLGTTAEITQAAPAIEHFRFLGWSLSADRSSADFAPGSEITASGNVDLYPVYIEDPKATLTYITHSESSSTTVYTGNVVTIGTGDEPVRDGYAFAGWRDAASSAVHGDGDSLAVTHDTILVAEWTPIPTTVLLTFHGTTEGDVSVVKVLGTATEITQTAPAVEHFEFLGWSLSADRSSADFAPGSVITASGNVDLYPIYAEDPKATVTYITHEGSASTALYCGTTVTVGTDDEPVRDGYAFAGWRDAESSAVYGNGDSLTVAHDTALVAEWTLIPDTITVTFHGTTEGDVSMVMAAGDVAEVTQTAPAIEHFEFLGWSLNADADAADFWLGSEISAFDDIDLYPLYEEDPKVTVTHVTHHGSTSTAVYAGTAVTVGTGVEPARSGYSFAGWRDAASSAVHGDGDSLAVTHDTILVAEWTPIQASPQSPGASQQQSGAGSGGSRPQASPSGTEPQSTQDEPATAPAEQEDPVADAPEESPVEDEPGTEVPEEPATEVPEEPSEVPFETDEPSEDAPSADPSESEGKKKGTSTALAGLGAVIAATCLGLGLIYFRKSRDARQTH